MTKTLNLKIQKLVLNKKFYVSRKNTIIKKSNYWAPKADPDGKIRNRLTEFERDKFIKNNKSLIKSIKNYKPKKILDIGCGPGFLLSALNKNKYELYGIENDGHATEYAKKYATIIKHDIDVKLLPIKLKFDLIVVNQVIEHVKKPENLIKIVKKNLKKNGILIIGTPDFDCLMSRFYNNKFRMLHDKTHISLFSRESLIRLLVYMGFEILKIEFPYFDTEYFQSFKNKKLDMIFNTKNKVSPPFYGNIMNVYARFKS